VPGAQQITDPPLVAEIKGVLSALPTPKGRLT
jgi:hypothetical protein